MVGAAAGRITRQAVRPGKRRDEPFDALPRARDVVQRRGNLLDVRLEIVCQIQQAATLGRQMAEMKSALLRPVVVGRPDREDRAADDAAFDLGAGVDAHRACGECHTATTVAALEPTRSFCLACHPTENDHYEQKECSVCHLQATPGEYRARLTGGEP